MSLPKAASYLSHSLTSYTQPHPPASGCHLLFTLILGWGHRSSVTLETMWLREASMLLFFLNFDLGSAVQISKFYASVRTNKAWLGLQLASQGGCSDINVISAPWLTLTIVHQSETKFPLVIFPLLSSKAGRELISVIAQWQCLSSNSCLHS